MTYQLSYKVSFIFVELIYTCCYFLTVNNRHYGRCYVKKYIRCVLFSLEFYFYLEANSARSKFFSQLLKGFKKVQFKKLYFSWKSLCFSLQGQINMLTDQGHWRNRKVLRKNNFRAGSTLACTMQASNSKVSYSFFFRLWFPNAGFGVCDNAAKTPAETTKTTSTTSTSE